MASDMPDEFQFGGTADEAQDMREAVEAHDRDQERRLESDAEYDVSQQDIAAAAFAEADRASRASIPVEATPEMVAEPDNALALAIAAHFGVEPDDVTAFIAVVEYSNDEGTHLSSAWSASAPVWRLRGIARELLAHLGVTN